MDSDIEYNNISMLMLACMEGDIEAVKDLIALETKMDSYDNDGDGMTALMWATQGGFLDIVELLVKSGVDVNRSMIYDDRTALDWAVDEGHIKIIQFLIGSGAIPKN